MTITLRPYQITEDYRRASRFLIAQYQPGNADGNWLEPAWEYMHHHPAFHPELAGQIGVWEDAGEMVALAHYEDRLGDAFFELNPSYRFLRTEMLAYAEEHLARPAERPGERQLTAWVNDNDPQFQAMVAARGYTRQPDATRPLYRFDVPDPFSPIPLPAGFRLISLADECDWAKVHRVMWRGFNHPGEPPEGQDELDSRRAMFDTPSARRDLKIVVSAPNGDFVAFCGMWYQPDHRYAYVEPVATDPAYRRMGLGKAAVLEGIRRCAELGARVAYVGSDQAFYQAIGFRKVFDTQGWLKTMPG